MSYLVSGCVILTACFWVNMLAFFIKVQVRFKGRVKMWNFFVLKWKSVMFRLPPFGADLVVGLSLDSDNRTEGAVWVSFTCRLPSDDCKYTSFFLIYKIVGWFECRLKTLLSYFRKHRASVSGENITYLRWFFFFLFDGLFLVGWLLLVSWDFFFFFEQGGGGFFFVCFFAGLILGLFLFFRFGFFLYLLQARENTQISVACMCCQCCPSLDCLN